MNHWLMLMDNCSTFSTATKGKRKKTYSVGFTYLKKKTHLSKPHSTVKFVSIYLIW